MKKLSVRTLLAFGSSVLAMGAIAEEEPVLNIYNWSDYIAEDTIAKFEEATGIKVTYDVYDSNEILEAKLFAGGTGYDLVVPTSEFFQRQAAAGIFQPLNKDMLPNLANMDPKMMEAASTFDPDNQFGVIYMWGTTGIGYNVAKVKEVLGEDAPVDSLALIFDPANAEKLSTCGLTILDAPTEVFTAALTYLGLDPNSTKEEDLRAAGDVIKAIQPFVRYFHSSQYIDDLAAGEICAALGWSGDVSIASADAAEGVEVKYSIPVEGALQWFDLIGIPADAQHPENAHKFINFVMDPQITADITNHVWYGNANPASLEFVIDEVKNDPSIFPPADVLAKLYTNKVKSSEETRLMNEIWSEVKAGK